MGRDPPESKQGKNKCKKDEIRSRNLIVTWKTVEELGVRDLQVCQKRMS